MSAWKRYYLAHSIEDALGALRSSPGPARLVAGGTDYLLELQQGHHSPVHTLVDITQVPDLTPLEIRGDGLYIGAGVPVCQITESPLVQKHAQAVAEACGLIGGPQVRNSATIGGNVAHALPAADGMIALVALDAQVEIASADENGIRRRCAPMLSLFAGPGKNTLVTDREMLVGFWLPLTQPGQASAFARVMRPQGVALPILNLAVWMEREPESPDVIRDVRIAVGPAGPVPQRARAVEDCLRGATFGRAALARAEEIWHDTMRFRTSPRRSTAEYRGHLSAGLFETVIQTAWGRAARVTEANVLEVR